MPEEQLLFAARTDNLELFKSIVDPAKLGSKVDVNTTDAFGLSPLHLAVKYQSTEVLPELLEEEVDMDPQERQDGDTPLHLAVRIRGQEEEETRNWIGECPLLLALWWDVGNTLIDKSRRCAGRQLTPQ